MSHGGIDIPVIETERLILRGFAERDFAVIKSIYADPEAMRFLGGVMNEYDAWRRMAAMAGSWQLRGFGIFCVEGKAEGECVGYCGPMRPHGWPDNEIGYTFAPAHHGKGYATEAAAASLAFAYERLGWDTAISLIDPDNHASQGVARKLGAVRERTGAQVTDFTADIWRHLTPAQFLARRGAA
ncbi:MULTISPECIES: GNAT family N-acetyltransferase [unclassified Roseitalea]|uniref:GNAT family N-acetyltransferase n=1 Tax=unclassified Roseitalea TaxID=2639107 RepID=UPI00273E7B43|nr:MULTISPECIES: GNAT family N-acetyltransferase [unclassified Roseitalea]